MSNLSVRVLVAVVGIPLILLITIYGGLLFLAFVFLISFLATLEYYSLVKKKNISPVVWLGAFGILALDLLFYFRRAEFLLHFLIVFVLFAGLVELFRKPSGLGWSAISNFSTTLFPVLYIGISLATLVGLRESSFGNLGYKEIGIFIISIFALIWICDTFAYFVGLSFGKKKLYERVSPKKTVEGFIGGLLSALIFAYIAKLVILKFLTLFDSLSIGLIVGILGQLGDLVESLLKRDAGVKDSSAIIPGHGGVLDRFDSLIYVAPFVYLYFSLIKPIL